MFTGIIEAIGQVKDVKRKSNFLELKVQVPDNFLDSARGDSIAVNGTCLTVNRYEGDSVIFDVMPETFKVTNLKNLKYGSRVNLEKSLTMSKPIGGHFVTGHVDFVGKVRNKIKNGNATDIYIQYDRNYKKYFVKKGSVTINGISLTVMDVDNDTFKISIIPVTFGDTNLSDFGIGKEINVECDILSKYVEAMFGGEKKMTLAEMFGGK
ncbi:MAG: riboflavin synthase [Firmicutes bacterium]|jgi:riboflavin synthase|nr:riboflavin synthase [Bacillota bacterium]